MGLQRSVECLMGSLGSLEDLTSQRQALTFWAMNWTIHPQLAQVICQVLNLRGGMMWDEGLPPGRILVLAETRTVTLTTIGQRGGSSPRHVGRALTFESHLVGSDAVKQGLLCSAQALLSGFALDFARGVHCTFCRSLGGVCMGAQAWKPIM